MGVPKHRRCLRSAVATGKGRFKAPKQGLGPQKAHQAGCHVMEQKLLALSPLPTWCQACKSHPTGLPEAAKPKGRRSELSCGRYTRKRQPCLLWMHGQEPRLNTREPKCFVCFKGGSQLQKRYFFGLVTARIQFL